ncbi:hypothetical protein O181_010725 [Austropuccinia psidii MF-1]|uniref:Uncharacterized protein n=1 Tax=Austropuccinia psidii MF-1 TaxID=1389203 RepID=A0A9Q3GL72_9BASI|nr:hypothetical protein [Austropuccinia psidii MF-1]
MSGHVYYRFKAQKDFQRIMFDGLGISVWDLKREIIQESKMGKGSDFDFAIYNADTEEEYTNDHAFIPRASSVIARRLPPKRPGYGNAQQYVNATPSNSINPSSSSTRSASNGVAHVDWRGGGAITKHFKKNSDQPSQAQSVTPSLTGGERDSEAESMAAMFAAQDHEWQKTQEAMATATRVGRNLTFRDRSLKGHVGTKAKENGNSLNGVPSTASNNNVNQPPPPQGYICYRCGQKGHWIQACPTNDNPEFEGRPRIKRTTGIPKSFLQKVEGKPIEGQNVMVTADGSFVIAKPDDASWKQHKSVVVKNLSAADIENQRPSDLDLACSICSTLLKMAVNMICCRSSFCENCISAYLKDHSSVCPECETKVSSTLSKAFSVDEERRTRSEEYVKEILKVSQEAQLERIKAEEESQKLEDNVTELKDLQKAQEGDHQFADSRLEHESDQNDNESSGKMNLQEKANRESSTELLKPPSAAEVANGDSSHSSISNSGTSSSSHVSPMVSMVGIGGSQEFDNYLAPMAIHNGSMGMMGMGMGMNGYEQQGMMINKMMEPMMIGGMGANHNVVMNSNQVGMYGGPVNGNGMGIEMGGRGIGELGMAVNQMMMMLQNPQLNEPMRMQIMIQIQNLQQQMMIVQRLGHGNMMMDHMGMVGPNGMNANGNLGNLATIQQQQDFNPNNSFGIHPTPNDNSLHDHSFNFQPHHEVGTRPISQFNSSSAYQRPPLHNGNSRRNWNHHHQNLAGGGGGGKRKRAEDLIELESGEKVPRYM